VAGENLWLFEEGAYTIRIKGNSVTVSWQEWRKRNTEVSSAYQSRAFDLPDGELLHELLTALAEQDWLGVQLKALQISKA
jgi:hypothetical protein